MYIDYSTTRSLYHKENHYDVTKSNVYYFFSNLIFITSKEPHNYNQKQYILVFQQPSPYNIRITTLM
jgi:hypothetical protein